MLNAQYIDYSIHCVLCNKRSAESGKNINVNSHVDDTEPCVHNITALSPPDATNLRMSKSNSDLGSETSGDKLPARSVKSSPSMHTASSGSPSFDPQR